MERGWTMKLLFDDGTVADKLNMRHLPVTLIVSENSRLIHYHNQEAEREVYLTIMQESLKKTHVEQDFPW